jgi:hypothetical protein
MTADPSRAGEPHHCCVCGDPHPRCLCARCQRAWAPGGVLPAWLRAIWLPAHAATEAARRNERRIARGPVPNAPGHGGARYAAGVTLVSLDALPADRLERAC